MIEIEDVIVLIVEVFEFATRSQNVAHTEIENEIIVGVMGSGVAVKVAEGGRQGKLIPKFLNNAHADVKTMERFRVGFIASQVPVLLHGFGCLFFNQLNLGFLLELVLLFNAFTKFFDVLRIFEQGQIESAVIFDHPRGGLTLFIAITLANTDVLVIAVFDDADVNRHKTNSAKGHNNTYAYAT